MGRPDGRHLWPMASPRTAIDGAPPADPMGEAVAGAVNEDGEGPRAPGLADDAARTAERPHREAGGGPPADASRRAARHPAPRRPVRGDEVPPRRRLPA